MLAVSGRSPNGRRDSNAASGTTAQTMPDPFVFVPITQAEAAKGRAAAKRIVRAHVTRVQHAKSSNSNSQFNLQTWLVKPYIHRESVAVRRKPRVGKLGEPSRKQSKVDKSSEKPREPREDKSPTTSDKSSTALVPYLRAGSYGDDPFWTYPVDYQPQLSPIIAHYIQNVAVEIPDIDGPNERGLLRRVWFPLCMTEPSTMYAVLLLSASHYCTFNPDKAALMDLLALKARALSEINAALAKPERATTDAVIGAVAKMASYEAIFGDSDVFAAHMKGLQMMLKLRGGLANLGLNGLLERMLVWIDLNACHLTGTALFFGGDEYPTKVSYDEPDPFHFSGLS